MAEIDINNLNATVASILPSDAYADVRLEKTEHGPEFVFSFKLPKAKDGEDGKNVYGVDLTDEIIWVPCLDDGTPDPDLIPPHATTRILLKEGDKIISEGVDYYIEYPETSGYFECDKYGDVNIILDKDSLENIDVICYAKYKKQVHQKTLHVKKGIGVPVYKIAPDTSAIKQDMGVKIPSVFRVDVLKWNGKSWGLANHEKEVKYNYTLMDDTGESGCVADVYWQDDDTCEWTIEIGNYNDFKTLEVYIEDENGVILDKESISIVKDGIGVITANAYAVVSSSRDISNYTVTGGTYSTINDLGTYQTLITRDEEGNQQDIDWKPTNANERSSTQTIWMISNVFMSTDDQTSGGEVWSVPVKLQDSDTFQVEYCAKSSKEIPTPLSFENLITQLVQAGKYTRDELTSEVLEAEWRTFEANREDPWEWGDDIENPIWMATCRLQSGKWSKWVVTKVQGNAGYNAKQIELSNESEYIPCINVTNADGTSDWVPDDDLYKSEDGSVNPIGTTQFWLMDGHKNITDVCKIQVVSSDTKLGHLLGENNIQNYQSKDNNGNLAWEILFEEKEEGTMGTLNVYKIYDDVTKLTISLFYDDEDSNTQIEYQGTFKLVKAKNATVYRVSPSVHALKVDSVGNAQIDEIVVSLRKWNGQRWEKVNVEGDDDPFAFDYSCAGVSNEKQTEPVTEVPNRCRTYRDGDLVINVTNEGNYTWPKGLPGILEFSVPIRTDDGEEIGVESESVPIVSDGVNIAGLYEFYAVNDDRKNSPSKINNSESDPWKFPEKGDDNFDTTREQYGDWFVNKIPELSATARYLWNIEVVVNSWGDVVEVTSPSIVGNYSSDGMTPYKVLEFYDIDDSAPEEKQDDKSEYVFIDGVINKNMPIPTTDHPYLYGFERVLYGKEGCMFSDDSVFYDASNGYKCIVNPTYSEVVNENINLGKSDKQLVEEGFIKYIDTPISLISKIGAGSITEQLYKYIAKGTSTLAEPSKSVLAVPDKSVGTFNCPYPGCEGDSWDSSEWNNWTDGIPSKIYDYEGKEIQSYNMSEHGAKVLYMTLRVFTTDGKAPQTEWKDSTIAADVPEVVDFAWSNWSEDNQPGPPGTEGFETAWSDIAQENTVWMAVRHMGSDGVWEEWAVTKIKGEKGDSGDVGMGALHLELTNDFTMVPTDDNGVVDSEWDEEDDTGQDLAISTARLFIGTTEVPSDKASFSWSITEGEGSLEDADTKTCSLIAMNTDSVTITCTATYNKQTISKDFNVIKSKGQAVYKLIPSHQFFIYRANNSNISNPEEITFTVSKWCNGKYTTVSNLSEENLTIIDSSGNSISKLTASKSEQTVTLKHNDVLVDQETIGWVEGGVKGDPGAGSISLSLSQDSATIRVWEDGTVKYDSDVAGVTSEAQLYDGGRPISGVTYQWYTDPNDLSTEWRTQTFKPKKSTINSWINDTTTVYVTAKYNEVDYTKGFQVIKSKSNVKYDLVLSSDVYNESLNYPSSIKISVKKSDGEHISNITDISKIQLYKGTTSNNKVTKLDSFDYTFDKDYPVITLYDLSGAFMDQEEVISVSNGESPYRLDLSNEHASFNCDSSGKMVSGAVKPACTATLYLGTKKAENVKYSISKASESGHKFSIDPDTGVISPPTIISFLDKVLNLEITAKIGNIICGIATYTITKNMPGENGDDAVSYWLNLSANEIKVDKDNNLSPTSVTASVLKQVGGNTPTTVNTGSNIKVKYGCDTTSPSKEGTTCNDFTSSTKYITFQLSIGGVIVDTETVTVLKDGTPGSPGTSVTVSKVEYGTSNSASTRPSSWSTTMPSSITQGHYLWTKTTFSDGKFVETYARQGLNGDSGSPGGQGPSLIFRGDYANSVTYYNETKRLDCVRYGSNYYIAKKTFTSSSSTVPPADDYWESFGNSFSSVATDTLLATNANVGNMVFNGTYFQDNNGGNKFYIDGSTGEVMFGSGSVKFKNDETGYLAGGDISWDASGKLSLGSGYYAYTGWWNNNIYPVEFDPANSKLKFNALLENLNKVSVYSPSGNVDVSCYFATNSFALSNNGIEILSANGQYVNTNKQAVTITCNGKIQFKSKWTSTPAIGATSVTSVGEMILTKYTISSDSSISTTSNMYSAGFYQSSDENLKTFENNICVDFDKLSKIPKSYFRWKDNSDNLQIGTSAQKVQELYPELVNTNENGNLTVDYSKLSIIALAAIDKLHEENVELKNRINKLEGMIYGNR